MAGLTLVLAGFLQGAWAVGLKDTGGFTRVWPTTLTIAGGFASFFLVAPAPRTIPIGTAYAVWAGIGAVVTAVLGMILFGEPRDLLRIACIGVVVIGAGGFKVAPAR